MNDLELALRMTADVGNVESAFQGVGGAAETMAKDIDAAADKAEGSTRGLDKVAGSAENLDDKAGRATGALGALSAGFELVGMEKYATGLQSASMATDFFSGIGQSATLILESQRLAQVKSTAASAVAAVQTKAQAVATGVLTVAQRGLNVAMRANPIGLIITAGLLLAGLFVLLYKRSDTFRSIVQAAGRVGKEALGWVVDKAQDIGRFIGDIPAQVTKFVDKLGWAKTLVKGYFEVMTLPARTLLNIIKDVVSWISKIDIPDLGDLGKLNPFGRVAGGGKAGTVGTLVQGRPATQTTFNITVNGALDVLSVAAQLRAMLQDLYRTNGWAVTF